MHPASTSLLTQCKIMGSCAPHYKCLLLLCSVDVLLLAPRTRTPLAPSCTSGGRTVPITPPPTNPP